MRCSGTGSEVSTTKAALVEIVKVAVRVKGTLFQLHIGSKPVVQRLGLKVHEPRLHVVG